MYRSHVKFLRIYTMLCYLHKTQYTFKKTEAPTSKLVTGQPHHMTFLYSNVLNGKTARNAYVSKAQC